MKKKKKKKLQACPFSAREIARAEHTNPDRKLETPPPPPPLERRRACVRAEEMTRRTTDLLPCASPPRTVVAAVGRRSPSPSPSPQPCTKRKRFRRAGGQEGGKRAAGCRGKRHASRAGQSVVARFAPSSSFWPAAWVLMSTAGRQQEVGGGRGGGVVNAGGEDEEEEGKDVALFVGRLAWAQTEKAATPLHLPLSS